jgi:hypothetical protein
VSWIEKAKAEVEKEADVEITKVRKQRDHGVEWALMEAGRHDMFYVFKNDGDSAEYVVEYVKEQMEDEPSHYGKFLTYYVEVGMSAVHQIAMDEREAAYDMISSESDEEACQRADMDTEWDDLQYEIEELEQEETDWDLWEADEQIEIQDQIDELEDEAYEEEDEAAEAKLEKKVDDLQAKLEKMTTDAKKRIEKEIKKLYRAQEDLAYDARDKFADEQADETEEQLNNDPIGWLEDRYGWSQGDDFPSWVSFDFERAADDAVSNDGEENSLGASYTYYTRSGYVAFQM